MRKLDSPTIIINNRRLSAKDPALIVAEIGLNHCGELNRAFELIHAASESGADAIKLQKRSPKHLLTKTAYNYPYNNGGNSFGTTYGAHREALEFSLDQYAILKEFADKYNLILFVSVWDEPSVSLTRELDLPIVKIPSADLTNDRLITLVSNLGKPIFISTGMSTETEISHAVSLLKSLEANYVLFHTVSVYPTPVSKSKLSTISSFQKKYNVLSGYSGHELEPSIAIAARALGACVIEKHFTIDRTWKGPDQAISLLPNEFLHMTKDIRLIETALNGVRVGIDQGEDRQRKKLAKSLVTTRDIAAGEIIFADMLCCKCPGNGISPQYLDKVIGKKVRLAIPADSVLMPEHLDGFNCHEQDTQESAKMVLQ